MITKRELTDAIDRIESSETSWGTVEKLACLYTVFAHLYGEDRESTDPTEPEPAKIMMPRAASSDFARTVEGKNTMAVIALIDELMQTIAITQPRLYDSVMRRLNEI